MAKSRPDGLPPFASPVLASRTPHGTRVTAFVCAGGALVDRTYVLAAPAVPRTSNPAASRCTGFGGVARNVAENLARLGERVALICAVGDDPDGDALVAHAGALGIDTRAIVRAPECATAEYLAVLSPGGELAIGVAHAQALERLTPEEIDRRAQPLTGAAWWFLDCNLSAPALARAVALARERGARVAIDTVSVAKARRLPEPLDGVDALFCNADEAAAYLGGAASPEACAARLRAAGARRAIVTDGARGVHANDGDALFAPALPARAVSATGAGDAFVAAVLHRLAAGDELTGALRAGTAAAALTVESSCSVREDLSPALLRARMEER